MFGKALKRTFWVMYDFLFKGALLNLLIFVSMAILLFSIYKMPKYFYVLIGLMLFIWHAVTPVFLYYWGKVIRRGQNMKSLATVMEGVKKFFYHGTVVFLINALFSVLAYIAIRFYLDKIDTMKIPAAILGGITLCAIVIFLLMQLYIMPIMVLDEKKRILISYKKAALMVMSTPFSSIMLLILFAYINLLFYPAVVMIRGGGAVDSVTAILTLFPAFGLPFVNYSLIHVFQMNATLLVYEKHGVTESLKEIWDVRKLSGIFKPWDAK